MVKNYVVIPITKGFVTAVSAEDAERVKKHNWYAMLGRRGTVDAVVTNICGHIVRLTHFILGKPKRGFVVDHLNRVPLDNRRCNLRVCSAADNVANVTKSNRFGYIGVGLTTSNTGSLGAGRYRAAIKHKGRLNFIGHFHTPKEAARAYDDWVRKNISGYHRLNFPGANEKPPTPPVEVVSAQRKVHAVRIKKLVGVKRNKDGTWGYSIKYAGWHVTKGGYLTENGAARARDEFILIMHWPRALNFPTVESDVKRGKNRKR